MQGYFGMKEYKFAVEQEIYTEVITWLVTYGIDYEVSLTYQIFYVDFRIITVKIKTKPELVIRDINQMLGDVRKNNARKSQKFPLL